MKKFLILAMLMSFGFCNIDTPIIEKQKYTVLDKKIANAAPIIEFFSFLCPHCYTLEQKYRLDDHIKNNISNSIKIVKYHVNFLGGELGESLTHIWEMSKMMELDKKILMPIFEKIQQQKTITDVYTLKNEFLKLAKIDEKEFNFLWNSFVVKSMLYNQQIIQNTLKIDRIPSIFINGKYAINNTNISQKSNKDFIKEYVYIVKCLLNKH
ncbi:MAG: DsbA family protein [Buchnera aphidicola (Kaburagia rhusicola rhusicola)]